MTQKRLIAAAAAAVGIALIVIAVVYWIEPASGLPGFFPGHEAGSSRHHVKHGVAAFVVGLVALVLAWFSSAPPRKAPAA